MRQKSQQFLSIFPLTGIIFTFRPQRGPHFFQFAIDFSLPRRYNIPRNMICGRSSMVEHQLPKLNTRVRFPSPAPGLLAKNDAGTKKSPEFRAFFAFLGSKKARHGVTFLNDVENP